MRKPIKPFAVETRRAGRRTPGARTAGEDEAPKALAPEWPPVPEEDESYAATMRAADALFSRPAPRPAAPAPDEDSPIRAETEPPRRILPSLNEDDHILRLLAQEDAPRPRRGRKPRDPEAQAEPSLAKATEASPAQAPAPVADAADEVSPSSPRFIAGYLHGRIYARYARHSETRPGEQWRKRGVRPSW